jgi:hypothetical protein
MKQVYGMKGRALTRGDLTGTLSRMNFHKATRAAMYG